MRNIMSVSIRERLILAKHFHGIIFHRQDEEGNCFISIPDDSDVPIVESLLKQITA